MAKQKIDDDLISQNQAARVMGVSVRTTIRKAAAREVTKNEDGLYSREECEAWAEAQAGEHEQSLEQTALMEIRQAMEQSTGHAERLVKLLENPINNALATVTSINEGLMKRLDSQESHHLDNMKFMGEMLLQKEERDAIRAETQSKHEVRAKAAQTVIEHLPTLLTQLGGKNVAKEFVSKLDDEERLGLSQLYWAFDDQAKRDGFGTLLKGMGVPIPPKPDDEPFEVPPITAEHIAEANAAHPAGKGS